MCVSYLSIYMSLNNVYKSIIDVLFSFQIILNTLISPHEYIQATSFLFQYFQPMDLIYVLIVSRTLAPASNIKWSLLMRWAEKMNSRTVLLPTPPKKQKTLGPISFLSCFFLSCVYCSRVCRCVSILELSSWIPKSI